MVTASMALALAAQELEQDPIVIKGEQALPKTLYIAPWKRVGEPLEADPLQGSWQPEARPLERDIFLNELELRRQGYPVDSALPSDSPPTPVPPRRNGH
jgi:hypothetical protein